MGCGSSTHDPSSPHQPTAHSVAVRPHVRPAGPGSAASGARSGSSSAAASAAASPRRHDKKKTKSGTEDRYEILKVLGEGASCKVVTARDRTSKQLFAMKIMDKSESYNKVLWENETLILRTLRHPNILEWVESYEDKKTFHLLTVLCQGGELFDRVKNGSFSEKVAARLAKEMLQAVHYCHANSTVHRDLKPENFVFDDIREDSNMKLIDFGCAKIVGDDEVINDVAGSPYYCLAADTLVAAADGGSLPAEQITKGMWLVGEDHRRVQVSDVIVFDDPAGVYTVQMDASQYRVTAGHMLTLRVDRNPDIRLTRQAGEPQARATVSYLTSLPTTRQCNTINCTQCPIFTSSHSPSPVASSGLHLRLVTFSWDVELLEDAAALVAESPFTTLDATEEIDLIVDTLEEAEYEESLLWATEPTSRADHPHAITRLTRGTRAEIKSLIHQSLQWMSHTACHRRGDLIEISAAELYRRRHEFALFTATPMITGRRVPITPSTSKPCEAQPLPVHASVPTSFPIGVYLPPTPSSCDDHDGVVSSQSMKLVVGGDDEFADLTHDHHARVVYQLHHPLVTDSHEVHSSPFGQLHLVRDLMGIDVRPSAGIVLTEVRPSVDAGTETEDATTHAYNDACQSNLSQAMNLNTDVIVAFGQFTRQQWLASIDHLRTTGSILSAEEEMIHGVRCLSIRRSNGRSLRVVFAPHPCRWRLLRWVSRALAVAHHRDPHVADRLAVTHALDRLPLTDLLPPHRDSACMPLPATVVNIAIVGDRECEKRYALADGTLTHNCAPEVLSDSYVRTGRVWKSADLWSVGVIVFLLVCGYPPFNGDSQERIFRKIKKGKFRFPKAADNGGVNLSDAVKNLITGLLQLHPKDRLTAADALKHPWISGDVAPDAPLPSAVVDALGAFRSKMRLKKAVARVLAHHMTDDDKDNLAVVFRKFDINGDGQLGADEIAELMRHTGKLDGAGDVRQLMAAMDEDGDGGVSMDEFATHVTMGQLGKDSAQIKATFDMFDLDHDGALDASELHRALGSHWSMPAVLEMIEEADENGDGRITFTEFLRAMADGPAAYSSSAAPTTTPAAATNNATAK